MTMRYGNLFQIDDFSSAGTARRLDRVALSGSRAWSGYDELWLQRLIANHPQALPIAEIESFLEGAVPICLELNTNAGPIDLVLATPRGDIVLVECKLWRNPQARREVVGQIIDYAKELPHLSYEAFDAAIRKAHPAGTATKKDTLYQRAGAEAAGVDEASFIDAVSRNLRRGRLLLLIVGDGIQEGVQNIVDFLQQHAGMHFTLALVEVAIFKSHPEGYLVQPRVLAKTQMVPRGVVSIEDDRVAIRSYQAAEAVTLSAGKDEASRPRPPIPATISEARLYEALEAKLPGGAACLTRLVAVLEERGASPRLTPTSICTAGGRRRPSAGACQCRCKLGNGVVRGGGRTGDGTRSPRCRPKLLPLSGVPRAGYSIAGKETHPRYHFRDGQPAVGRSVVGARGVVGRYCRLSWVSATRPTIKDSVSCASPVS